MSVLRCNLCPASVHAADGQQHVLTVHADLVGITGEGHHYQPTWGDGDVLTVACTWHRHYWPCRHGGKRPFGGPPVDVDELPSPEEALAYAIQTTGGARQVVQHRGSMRDGDHTMGAACWCGPLVHRPVGVGGSDE